MKVRETRSLLSNLHTHVNMCERRIHKISRKSLYSKCMTAQKNTQTHLYKRTHNRIRTHSNISDLIYVIVLRNGINGLVGFYGISTTVGNLMPNTVIHINCI